MKLTYEALLRFSHLAFSVRLQQLMDRDSVTYRDLERVLKIYANNFYLYMKGESFPRYERLLAIATFFEVPIELLVGQDRLTLMYLDKKKSEKELRSVLHDEFLERYHIDPLLAIHHWKRS